MFLQLVRTVIAQINCDLGFLNEGDEVDRGILLGCDLLDNRIGKLQFYCSSANLCKLGSQKPFLSKVDSKNLLKIYEQLASVAKCLFCRNLAHFRIVC